MVKAGKNIKSVLFKNGTHNMFGKYLTEIRNKFSKINALISNVKNIFFFLNAYLEYTILNKWNQEYKCPSINSNKVGYWVSKLLSFKNLYILPKNLNIVKQLTNKHKIGI